MYMCEQPCPTPLFLLPLSLAAPGCIQQTLPPRVALVCMLQTEFFCHTILPAGQPSAPTGSLANLWLYF